MTVKPKLVLMLVALLALTMLVPSVQAADPQDRVLQILDDAAQNGTVGLYLRQIDGPTIAAVNENFVFEPASTIKALIHFHAMKQVQVNPAVSLTTMIPVFLGPANYSSSPGPGQTSCPDNSTLPSSDTLQNGLIAMMNPSDNRWTQAMRDYFGDANIDATRQAFGMTNTALNHRIGCGADAVANPNQLTLVDAGKMYEAVATGGFLNAPTRAAAFSLMTQDNGAFNAVIDSAAAGMGLSASSIAQFKSLRQSANKAGSYGLSTGSYLTVAGWSTVPWKDPATCEADVRNYVYGAFIDGADSIDSSFNIRATGVELFREQIHAALESWVACEADLEITSSVVVDPPAEMDVNTPTVLTVRVAMRSNGPASTIDGVLTRTTDVPSDCTVSPTDASSPVPAMAAGHVVTQEMDFTVECSNPSSHTFVFDSLLEPDIPAVVDIDPTNNDGMAGATIAVIARADLAVTGWDFSELDGAGLGDTLVGKDFTFSTAKVIDDFGDTLGGLYSAPIDTTVSRSVEVPAGVRGIVTIGADEAPADVTIERPSLPDEVHAAQPAGMAIEADGPATITVEFSQPALAVIEARALSEEFGFQCLEPGEHDLTFTNSIAAVEEHVVDPDGSNNSIEIQRTVDCATPVQINFRPGNAQNFVNVNSKAQLPVAVLTTDVGEYGLPVAFDATTIDSSSVRFGTADALNNGGGASASPDKAFIRDAQEATDEKSDKVDDDMVLSFDSEATGFTEATTEGCAYGKYADGGNSYSFYGCDAVVPHP